MKKVITLVMVVLVGSWNPSLSAEPSANDPITGIASSEAIAATSAQDVVSTSEVSLATSDSRPVASGADSSVVALAAPTTNNASDTVLGLIEKKLPQGWKMNLEGELLTFERAGDIWVMNVNRINAEPKLEFPKERQAIIKAQGKKTQARMVFKVTPRLTLEQMHALDTENARIDAEIASLPEKMGVSGFLDENLSRKVGPVYTATAPEDLKKIEEYQKVREEMSTKRLKYPDFNTERYSLWLLEKEGWEDEFHEVNPPEASQQSYEVHNIIESACKGTLQ